MWHLSNIDRTRLWKSFGPRHSRSKFEAARTQKHWTAQRTCVIFNYFTMFLSGRGSVPTVLPDLHDLRGWCIAALLSLEFGERCSQ